MNHDYGFGDSSDLVDVRAPDNPVEVIYLVKWMFQLGDMIDEGDGLADILADAEAMLLLAPVSGVLAEILIEGGGKADPGGVIGRIRPNGAGVVPPIPPPQLRETRRLDPALQRLPAC
jgi:2-oxoglutarate dehydrogenase E2 component (dihydrolipoamide succinyltransferase)